jgi:hypothetical protein
MSGEEMCVRKGDNKEVSLQYDIVACIVKFC